MLQILKFNPLKINKNLTLGLNLLKLLLLFILFFYFSHREGGALIKACAVITSNTVSHLCLSYRVIYMNL